MRTFNRPGSMVAAINSIQQQTYGNFELIVVDDNSTDNTQEVLELLSRQDSRIRIVKRLRNSRLYPREEPMNDGLWLAKGEYIAHLDDDNLWRNSFLERLVSSLIEAPEKKLAYADTCEHYDKNDKQLESLDMRDHFRPSDTEIVYPHRESFSCLEFQPGDLGYWDYIDTNEMMYRYSALVAIGGSWSLGHPLKDRINKIQGPQYFYRLHNDVEIAERIVALFGTDALIYVPEVLVDYYEKSFIREIDIKAMFNRHLSIDVEKQIEDR